MHALTRLAPWLLWLALAFSIAAPAGAQATATEGDGAGSIRIDDEGPADAAVAERLRGILAQFPDFADVTVEVDAGVVQLGGRVDEASRAKDAEQLAWRIEGIAAVRNDIAWERSVEKQLLPAVERLEKRARDIMDFLPLLGIALIVFLIFLFLGVVIARLAWPWNRIAPNPFVADLIRQVVRLAFFVAGLVVALDILAATALLGTILGAAGILGLAIGFAVRDTIENYIASIMLSVRQPFAPNDHIKIGEFEGHVIRLTSRATVLMSLDGNHIRIPNADVFKGTIVNFTHNPERRFEFSLGVAADCNLRDVVELGVRTLDQLDFVLKHPEPSGRVEEVGDSNVTLWFGGWIDQRVTDFGKGRGEAIRLTKRALEEAGIALPEPAYRVLLERARAPGAPRPEAAPGVPAGPAAPVESAEVGDASMETAVTEKVEEERSIAMEEDLLDPNARRE